MVNTIAHATTPAARRELAERLIGRVLWPDERLLPTEEDGDETLFRVGTPTEPACHRIISAALSALTDAGFPSVVAYTMPSQAGDAHRFAVLFRVPCGLPAAPLPEAA